VIIETATPVSTVVSPGVFDYGISFCQQGVLMLRVMKAVAVILSLPVFVAYAQEHAHTQDASPEKLGTVDPRVQ
jgi:hypothetical protein